MFLDLTCMCYLLAYLCMARTTLVLDDNLLRQLKKKASDEGRTFQAVANELLRRALTEPSRRLRSLLSQRCAGSIFSELCTARF